MIDLFTTTAPHRNVCTWRRVNDAVTRPSLVFSLRPAV